MLLCDLYFELDFFYPENRKIDCLFIANNDTEYYSVTFANEDICLNSVNAELFSTWTSFFDSQKESYKVNLLYSKVENFYNLTCQLSEAPIDNEYLKKYLIEYKNLAEFHPFFLMYYSIIYSLVNSILLDNNKKSSVKNELCQKLNLLMNKYKEFYKYVIDVLVEPFQYGLDSNTSTYVIKYERFLMANSIKSPLFSDTAPLSKSWGDELCEMVLERKLSDIELKEFKATFICHNDLDYSLEFSRGIYYYIDNYYFLRQCPLCKGYFKSRPNLLISYCNKIYKNNLTCQEFSSKRMYKKKINSHPIYIEYTRIYNKLYYRIQRKTLLKENAKLAELKALHEKYYYEYEKSPYPLKEGILKEFIKETERLFQQ